MKISLRVTSLLIAYLGLLSTAAAISNCCSVDANRLGCDDQVCQDLICASGLGEDCCTVGWTELCVNPTNAQVMTRNAMESCSVCAPAPRKGLRKKSGGK